MKHFPSTYNAQKIVSFFIRFYYSCIRKLTLYTYFNALTLALASHLKFFSYLEVVVIYFLISFLAISLANFSFLFLAIAYLY